MPKAGELPNEKLRLAITAPTLETAKSYLQSVLTRLNIANPTYEETSHPLFQNSILARVGSVDLATLGHLSPDYRGKTGLKKDYAFVEADFQKIIELAGTPRQFQLPPKYPEVREDISLVVDDSATVRQILQEARSSSKLLRRAEYKSIYTGEGIPSGKKAITLSLTFRSDEKTLTNEEIKQAREEVIGKLKKELKATIR